MSHGLLVPEATQALRQWLASSQLKPGARLPSERSLARDLGIRHYAVNRAMATLVAEREVERRGQKLFYSPQGVTSESFTCDLVAPARSVYLPSYRRVAREIGVTLRVHGWQSMEQGVSTLYALDSPNTESVIFEPAFSSPASRWEGAVDRLAAHAVPVVVVSQPSRTVPAVMADYTRGLHQAIQHFRALGHEELALVTPTGQSPESIEVLSVWGSVCKQYGCDSSAVRIFPHDSARLLQEDVHELAGKITEVVPAVTGVVVYSESESAIPYLIRELAERRKLVPRNISLISLRDSLALRNSVPPITATAVDMAAMQEAAMRAVQRAARKKEEPKASTNYAPWQLRVQPNLVVRSSTAPRLDGRGTLYVPSVQQGGLPKPLNPATPGLDVDNFAFSPRKTSEELLSALRQAYPLTRWAQEERFQPVDLAPYTNRPLNYRRGWLGDLPLKHLTAGKHMIHGVPFQVLGGTSRAEGGAIVFHSTVNSVGHARELPDTLSIPIDAAHVQAIYILHGCGYAKHRKHFGTYRFLRGRKEIEAVPLVSYGQPQPGGGSVAGSGYQQSAASYLGVAPNQALAALHPPLDDETSGEAGAGKEFKAETAQPNIQDWWPDFPHMDFPHARMAPIMESRPEDAAYQHVYLYTLEWVNPQPESKVTHLEISVDPTQSTTLGMLAITILHK
ncbi:MAG: substrate-binding domain-containing protein [Candidatus Methylacidiphilales bacterium]|nr:substrate-binding domain-containing protein [Candidatus Methylacidiphilales bacterium]